MGVHPRDHYVPPAFRPGATNLQEMLGGFVPTDPCAHATRRFEASIVPEVVREISELDPASEGVVGESPATAGTAGSPQTAALPASMHAPATGVWTATPAVQVSVVQALLSSAGGPCRR